MFEHVMDIVRPFRGGEDTSRDTDVTSSRPAERAWSMTRFHARTWAREDPAIRSLLRRKILRHARLRDALPEALGERLGLAREFRRFVCRAMNANLVYEDGWDTEERYVDDLVGIDLMSIQDRDPACENLAHAFLFFKGFCAIAAHRVAHALWVSGEGDVRPRSRGVALMLQSRASDALAVDIHPAARIRAGLVMDHAHGVVIGETAVVGSRCTMLHGVTLGATGKERGDRHPKIGDDVLIGAHVTMLGSVRVGSGSKIGAGALVLRSLPERVTAVGVPAKVVGSPKENEPSKELDHALHHFASIFGGNASFDSLWSEMDTDGDGQLSANEVVAQLMKMGLSKEHADCVYLKLDSNLDGHVDSDEFKANWNDALRSVSPAHELCA